MCNQNVTGQYWRKKLKKSLVLHSLKNNSRSPKLGYMKKCLKITKKLKNPLLLNTPKWFLVTTIWHFLPSILDGCLITTILTVVQDRFKNMFLSNTEKVVFQRLSLPFSESLSRYSMPIIRVSNNTLIRTCLWILYLSLPKR